MATDEHKFRQVGSAATVGLPSDTSYFGRWGRVGESGQNSLEGPRSAEEAVAIFMKKFKDKTSYDDDL